MEEWLSVLGDTELQYQTRWKYSNICNFEGLTDITMGKPVYLIEIVFLRVYEALNCYTLLNE
jgi:hypothetical protein